MDFYDKHGNGLLPEAILNAVVSQVTRVEVIDETGRAYTKWPIRKNVELQLQDNERTLKIFI